MPNTNMQGGGQGEKFVGRVEMAIMQFVIMGKAQQGGVTKENLQQLFRGGELQMTKDHLDHCLQILVAEEHLKQEGNKYTITDDGREDVQKVQHLILAVPNVIGLSGGSMGGQNKQQQQTAAVGGKGGMGGGNVGGTTGSPLGQQGNVGRGQNPGSGVGDEQIGTQNQGNVGKGGATNPGSQKGNQR